jgi:hypothetical protein
MPYDGAKPKDKGEAGLLIALGGPDKPGAGGAPAGDIASDEPAMGDVKEMAASDAFDAVKSGDRALFGDALDRYVKACMSEV